MQRHQHPSSMASPQQVRSERRKLLKRFEQFFELPLIVLGFVWLGILIIEFAYQTSPLLETVGVVIWVIFIIDFVIKFILAPVKLGYLKKNVLTMVSLAVPALRIFRIFRVLRLLRFSRGIRLVRVLGSLNRGMGALSKTMERRAFGYVAALSLIVLFGGAAGMYAFERTVEGGAIKTYGAAVWWTVMILTTLGSEYWPKTIEGRILCVVLGLYAFAVFGYVTATLSSFFIGQDAESKSAEVAGSGEIEALKKEVRELKEVLKQSRGRL